MGSILNLIPFFGATRRNHALNTQPCKCSHDATARLAHGRDFGSLSFTLWRLAHRGGHRRGTGSATAPQVRGEGACHPPQLRNKPGSQLRNSRGNASMVIWGLAGKRAQRWFIPNGRLGGSAFLLISRPLGPKMRRAFTVEPNLGHQQVRLVESCKTGNSFVHVISTGR